MIFPNLDNLSIRQLSDKVAHAYYGRPCRNCLHLDWPTAGLLIKHFRITIHPYTWLHEGVPIHGWSAGVTGETDQGTSYVLDPDPIRAIGKAIVYDYLQREYDGL